MRKKIGRNDPCPCGSGLKFKKCCLRRSREQPNHTPNAEEASLDSVSETTLSRNDEHLKTGSIRGSCLDPGGPDEKLGLVRDRADALVKLASAYRDRSDLTCNQCVGAAPGCCYQPVGTSFQDALTILAAYPGIVSKRWRELREQSCREEPLGAPIALDGKNTPQGLAFSGPENLRYTRKRISCVFLTADGRCAVYDVRPWACALHFTWSDPRMCSPDEAGADGTSVIDSASMHLAMLSGEVEVLKEVGIKPVLFRGLASAILHVAPFAPEFGIDFRPDEGASV